MSKHGIFISVAEDQEGKSPRIVTKTEGLPVVILDLDGESVADQHGKAIKVINTEHAWVHEGKAFVAGYYDAALADDGIISLLIEPGNAMHAIGNISGGGDLLVEFIINPTATAGTSLTIFNKNNFSSITSGATITHSPTGVSGGTATPETFIPGGSGGNAQGGSEGFDREWIFNPANTYLLRVTNLAGLAKPVSVNIEFYEPNAT